MSYPIITPPMLPKRNEDGLLLYLPFHEGTGRIAKDLSGYDNHCTLDGAVWQPSSGNRSFNPFFDGSNDRGTCGKKLLPSGADFTIMGWLNCQGDLAGTTDNYGVAFGAADWVSQVRGCIILHVTGFLRVNYGDGTTSYNLSIASEINAANSKKWYHVAASYKNATQKMQSYKNGSIWTSYSSQAYAQSSNNFEIAHSDYYPSVTYWYGQLKHIRIFNRVLSAEEIQAIYEAEV